MESIWRENLPQIEIKSINAFYEKLHVLKNIELNVSKGEIVSLIGPSGSGKSSLLKMLVGLLIPKSGKMYLNGNLVNFIEDLSEEGSKDITHIIIRCKKEEPLTV